jgi:hypothetical protein
MGWAKPSDTGMDATMAAIGIMPVIPGLFTVALELTKPVFPRWRPHLAHISWA